MPSSFNDSDSAACEKWGWPRAGEASDVGDGLDFAGGEKSEEVGQGVIGVADGVEGGRHREWGSEFWPIQLRGSGVGAGDECFAVGGVELDGFLEDRDGGIDAERLIDGHFLVFENFIVEEEAGKLPHTMTREFRDVAVV